MPFQTSLSSIWSCWSYIVIVLVLHADLSRSQLTGTDHDIPPGTPGASTMQMSPPLTDINSNAVCMDGSSGNYYFKAGSGSGQNTWLLFLQGGFWRVVPGSAPPCKVRPATQPGLFRLSWAAQQAGRTFRPPPQHAAACSLSDRDVGPFPNRCYSQQNCEDRMQQSHFMASSTGWSDLYALEGIFSDDPGQNPAFYNANLVFLKYCSGDGWMGDATAFGYQFRGQVIIHATVQALVQQHGLSNGDRFLFGGCSAGGLGALVAIDSVASQLATLGAPDVHFGGFFDASGWPDIQQPSWTPTTGPDAVVPLVETVQQLATFINPTYSPACAAANQGSEYLCIYPSVALPYVQTPFFLNAAQFDSFYFDYTLNGEAPEGSQQVAWAETYQQAELELFSQLPPSASIFSTSCEGHCLSLNTTFSQLDVNGAPISALLSYWFLDNAGGTGEIRNIDPCIGWGCINQCSGGMWSPTNSQCDAPSDQEQETLGFSPYGGGTGPFCGTPGAVPAGVVAQNAQAVAYANSLQSGTWSFALGLMRSQSAESDMIESAAADATDSTDGAASGPVASSASGAEPPSLLQKKGRTPGVRRRWWTMRPTSGTDTSASPSA